MSKRVSVTVHEGGPFEVEGAERLSFCGEPIDHDGSKVWLCRCGHSKNAPFCDGTHNDVGIVDNPERSTKDVHVWEGRTLRTRFNPNACMHVFYCKPLKALREAELAGDDEAAQKIAAVVDSCPSGALSWEAKVDDFDAPSPAETPVSEADRSAQIAIQEGGEVRMQCAFDLNAELPEGLEGDRATLCRCGLSTNKPFCDGRHRKREDFR